jgi:lysophospholipase L1-like esterase
MSRRPTLRVSVFVLAGAGLLLVFVGGRAAVRLHAAVQLARASEPLQQIVHTPQARLLVVGDSTAVGTGASWAQGSVAGQLAARFPHLHIENRARDGATLADMLAQLDAPSPRVDIILVQAGGNDVMRGRSMRAVRRDVDAVTRRATALADLVILMPPGNVGNAPFFFRPLSWLATARARELHEAARTAAQRHGASYVNLFRERAQDPFSRDADLNARDGLHPSHAGYRLWFQELMAQSPLATWLARAGDRDVAS